MNQDLRINPATMIVGLITAQEASASLLITRLIGESAWLEISFIPSQAQ
ncbi:hypothetical protein [Gilvimarinus chinensis]|nr:hypothetical protein [Gilvimarinus chinensis]